MVYLALACLDVPGKSRKKVFLLGRARKNFNIIGWGLKRPSLAVSVYVCARVWSGMPKFVVGTLNQGISTL